MYPDALSFLEDEREGWRAFEALDDLTDEQLLPHLATVHGWSGRDLMAHLVAPLELAMTVAKELAINESSPAKIEADADWDTRGDEINEEIQVAWQALPMDEVRHRFRTVPGELRGYLTVVPETRWLKDPDYEEFFLGETIDHYEAHTGDLAAVLASVNAT